ADDATAGATATAARRQPQQAATRSEAGGDSHAGMLAQSQPADDLAGGAVSGTTAARVARARSGQPPDLERRSAWRFADGHGGALPQGLGSGPQEQCLEGSGRTHVAGRPRERQTDRRQRAQDRQANEDLDEGEPVSPM